MLNLLVIVVLVGLALSTVGRQWLNFRQMDDPDLYHNPFKLFTDTKHRPIKVLLLVALVILAVVLSILKVMV